MKNFNSIIFDNLLFLPEIFLLFSLPFLTLFVLINLVKSQSKNSLNFSCFFFNLIFGIYFLLVLKNVDAIAVGFNSFLHVTAFINTFKLLLIIQIIILNCYSVSSLKQDSLFIFEFFFFIAMCLLGSIIVISSGSLLSFILGLEIQSLSLYILIALRTDSILAVEASIKYFLIGVVATILTFIGIFFIYLQFSTITFTELAQLNLNSSSQFWLFSLLFLMGSIFFKLAVFPFQFWAPDIYQSAQTSVVLFISTISKLTVVVFLVRIFCINILFQDFYDWSNVMLPFILVTLIIGAIRGLSQTNIKRILAYSSMVNISFIMLCLTTFSYNYHCTFPAQLQSLALFNFEKTKVSLISLTLFYVIVYVLLNLIFFLCLMVLKKISYHNSYREVKVVSDLNGLFHTHPTIAFIMLTVLLSFCGLPPFLGFFSKYYVLIELLNQEQFFLATLVLFFSIVTMVYYMKIITAIFFVKKQNLSDKATYQAIPSNYVVKSNFYANPYLQVGIFFINLTNIFGMVFSYYLYKFCFSLAVYLILNFII